MRRLGVIGTFVWDTIHHPGQAGRSPLEQWGGVAYSLSAFSAACPPGWCIQPIVRIGADLADQAERLVSSLPNIRGTEALRVVPQPNNRVELRYFDDAERTEQLSGGIAPWSAPDLDPLLAGVDALFINYISGFELDLTTAERVRRMVQVPIYADLHSLCLGPPRDGPRQPRPLARADRWVRTADYLQVNEAELELVGGMEAVRQAARRDLTLLITRGPAGASFLCTGSSENEPSGGSLEPVHGVVEGDPTGCGDVWGAVAFCGILEGLPIEVAVERANVAAAAKLGHPRMDGLAEAIELALTGNP